ncbi:hypothetical protein [Metamycoplasma canadense]|uniref:DUF3899 domain-containing protein n=1 Tax=Metamycoplasma canadense TaxID=29554 RepID=A0A077L6Y0_9BACT|nr:hypothetical protein [Metamycoplasma canadense]BAP39556.1 hypothetical protein MCAN360_0387 [Metamycoplasma canadense]
MRFKNKSKLKFKSRNSYWRRSWNIYSVVYFFTILFLMVLMILLTGFLKKQSTERITWSNAITAGCVTIFGLSTIVILVRKGLGKNIIKPFSSFYHNQRIMSRAKGKWSSTMTQHQKDKIIARERSLYENEQSKKSIEKAKNEVTNLSSYLLISISLVTLTIGLLAIHLS